MNFLTKYETSKVIGIRALQLQNGSRPLVQVTDERLCDDAVYIAALELKNGLLDFKLRRHYPFEKVEEVHGSRFVLPPDLDVLIRTKRKV